MNLQQKVRAALVALVSVFTLVQAGLAIDTMHDQEDELVDQMVAEEAQRLSRRLERLGPEVLGSADEAQVGDHYQAWWQAPDGRSWPAPVPADLLALRDGPHVLELADTDLHRVVLPAAGGRLFLQYDAVLHEDKVHVFRSQVLVLAVLFIALAVWVAHRLSVLIVGPLRQVTQLLSNWAPAEAGSPAATGDEAGELLAAFNRVQARWEAGLAREGEHAANLRHEIRTPLAALRTDLEMALLDASLPEPLQQRLQRTLTSADAIQGALQSVAQLQAQRGEPAAPTLPVALHTCVQDAWESLGDWPTVRQVRLDNEVADSLQVMADRHALLTILRNLMRNAAEHAAPARCRVHVQAGALVVEDDGPGIPAADLPFVFDRYYRGRLRDSSPSTESDLMERGLGLAIARQVADLHHWRLQAEAVHPRGTRFLLHFQTDLTEV